MKKVLKFTIILVLISLICIIIKNVFFNDKNITVLDKNKIITGNKTINCIVFDGTEIRGSANIKIENGKLLNENIILDTEQLDSNYFIMPGLIDAHTHTTSQDEIHEILNNGVTTIYDVASSESDARKSETLNIWTATTTIMPGISNGKKTVNNLISQGADYIKVMVDMPSIMGGELIEKSILKDIVDTAHQNNLKIVAHVTTIEAVELAVDCNVDILIHVPIGEKFPEKLAKKIADKDIAVVPTLVMMKAFANSLLYGFKESDYKDAENAVKLLNSYGVKILVGTDANSSFFAPKIEHGSSVHEEMKLLVDAGLSPIEVLQGTTTKTIEAFGLEKHLDEQTYSSIMVLIEGRPDKNITDTTKIRQIWIDGEPLYESLTDNNKNA